MPTYDYACGHCGGFEALRPSGLRDEPGVAGRVFGALDVPARPEEVLGVPGEHQSTSSSDARTQVSFEPPP